MRVKSECLCLLAYFAIQTGRAKRTDVSDALVEATFSGKINDLKARKNWWSRKFGNIAYAWKDAGLADSVVHGKKHRLLAVRACLGKKVCNFALNSTQCASSWKI